MNRMTERVGENFIRIKGISTVYDTRNNGCQEKAVARLAEYEDIELYPEVMKALKLSYSALERDFCHLILESHNPDACKYCLHNEHRKSKCPLKTVGYCKPMWRGP